MAVVENRGPELLKVCVTLLVFAVTASCLRCITRTALVKAFGLDDWFMVLATISFTLFVACATTGIHYGTGRHFADLKPDGIEEAMKFWWFCYIWYCLTMITSKVSIGVFLLRICVQKIHRYLVYIVTFLSVVTGIVFFFVTIFQCNPVSFFWGRVQGTSGSCVDTEIIVALTYLYSACSVICDFTFALLPFHMIRGLQMDRKTKIALVPILGMGCVASVAVAVRFAYIEDFKNPDFLWATLDIAIWSTVEQGLAITAGSLATLRPLIRLFFRWLGLQDSRAGTPGPSSALPPTIGSGGRGKGSKGSRASKYGIGSYALATLDVESGNEEGHPRGERESKNQILVKRDVEVSSNREKRGNRDNIWGLPEDLRNDSEEELTPGALKETFPEPQGSKVVPKSFLSSERRGHNNGSSY